MFNSVWYDNLIKPVLNPPQWIFAPVWGILYALMLAALTIYIIKQCSQKKEGYIYFSIQLFLNFLWSPIFFYFKNMSFAFFIIVLLDIFVILTIRFFYSVSRISGILLVPYLIWIIFATYLNISFLILN